jgi:hypothetical protein
LLGEGLEENKEGKSDWTMDMPTIQYEFTSEEDDE